MVQHSCTPSGAPDLRRPRGESPAPPPLCNAPFSLQGDFASNSMLKNGSRAIMHGIGSELSAECGPSFAASPLDSRVWAGLFSRPSFSVSVGPQLVQKWEAS